MVDSQAYLLRISQAGPVGLVVINFEILLDYLEAAKKAASLGVEEMRPALGKAKDALAQLIQSLDFTISLSHDFYDIYSYAFGKLSSASSAADIATAIDATDEVAELMETLLKGWRETAKNEPPAPENENTPKVYTGLTYGRDGKADEYIDEGKNRGYMA